MVNPHHERQPFMLVNSHKSGICSMLYYCFDCKIVHVELLIYISNIKSNLHVMQHVMSFNVINSIERYTKYLRGMCILLSVEFRNFRG